MSVDGQRRNGEPQIDLETIRETLAYIHGDLDHSPRLHKLRDALGAAVREIEALERTAQAERPAPEAQRVVAFPGIRPVFKPWRADARAQGGKCET